MLYRFISDLGLTEIHKKMSSKSGFFRVEFELEETYCTVNFKPSDGDYKIILCPKIEGLLGKGELYRGRCAPESLKDTFLNLMGSFLRGERQLFEPPENVASYMLKKTHSTYMNEVKGRGVFANFNLKKRDLIEVCPVLEISPAESAFLMTTQYGGLVDYVYPWVFPQKAIPLGYGVLYNSPRPTPEDVEIAEPNAIAVCSTKRKQVYILALRNISFGEEILIDYWGMEGSNNIEGYEWVEFEKILDTTDFNDPAIELLDLLSAL